MGSPGEFGYPERNWDNFAGGDMLLAALGEREVRDRLRLGHPTALQNDGVAECSERLLLLESGAKTSEDLLCSLGGPRDILARRLEAVGLSQHGSSEECARRLLLLLESSVLALGPEHLPDFGDEDEDFDDLPPLMPLEHENFVGPIA